MHLQPVYVCVCICTVDEAYVHIIASLKHNPKKNDPVLHIGQPHMDMGFPSYFHSVEPGTGES